MTENDFEKFSEVVLGFAELKGKQLSAPAIELYFRALQDWELDDFRAAAGELLRGCEFMPTPKDFEELRRAGQLTAGEAWAYVLSRFPGRQPVPTVPNPEERTRIERAVLALGGWGALGRNSPEQNDRLERRFSEHYTDLQTVDEVRHTLPQIASSSATPRIVGARPIAVLRNGRAEGSQ